MSSGVVGREAELASLRGFVSSIPAGAVVLALEGDAGVGKTTLWEAGLEEAGDRGFRVLAARPAESETALSFSGIGDLLDPVLDEALAPLPAAQSRALSRALVLGDDEGPPPDPHAIGLALLTRCVRSPTIARSSSRSMTSSGSTRPRPPASPTRAGDCGPSASACSSRAVRDSRASSSASFDGRCPPTASWTRRRRPARRRRSASRRAGTPGPGPAETGSRRRAGRVRRQPVLRPRDRSHPAAQRRLRRSRATLTRPRVPARPRPRTPARAASAMP